MANSPIVTSLPSYVEQRRLPLIGKAVLGAVTAKLLTLQTDIKHSAALNLLTTDVAFGNGADCGWNEAGTATMSQRTITVGNIKINMAFCDKKLLATWAGYEVRVAAGEKDLPFEEYFVEELIKAIQSAVEKAIWQGDTASSDANLNKFDGLLKILGADAGTIDETIAAGATYIAAVQQMLTAIPAAAIAEDTVIFASPEFIQAYGQALVSANLYHYIAGEDFDTFRIPGSRVRLVAAPGLTGTSKLVAGRLSNMFYGTDMMGDEEKFDIWYSKDNREFRVAVEFNAGVQVAFPDHIVLGTYTTLA